MAYDASTSNVVLYGGTGIVPGQDYSGTLQDTWTWDGTTWSEQTPANPPSVDKNGDAPTAPALAYDVAASQLVLFDGFSADAKHTPDVSNTWLWTGSNWQNVTPLPSNPPIDYSNVMTYDASTNQMISVVDGETFEWTGANWVDLNPASSPPGYGLLAYDAAAGQLIWFEENAYPTNASSTWSWDGRNWRELSPPTGPGLVNGVASLAYDTATSQLLLVGTFGSGSSAAEETWTWDGQTWTQQAPSSSPGPLSDASMAFDPTSGDLILFGGFDPISVPAVMDSTTWAWNGSTWSQLEPSASPPALADGSFAYDPQLGEDLLFGGLPCLQDQCIQGSDASWAWNGTDWTELAFADNPSERYQSGMAWDGATQQMVMTGGDEAYVSPVFDSDTWLLTSQPIATPTIIQETPGYGSVTVTWSIAALNPSVLNEMSFNVSETGGPTVNVASDVTSYVFSGLNIRSTGYTFIIAPESQAGTFPSSPLSAPVEPLGAKPDDGPTNVTATCGDQSATVAWSAASPAVGDGPVTGYEVTGPDGPDYVGASATSATVTGLVNGTGPDNFSVAAEYAAGPTAAVAAPSCTPYSSTTAPVLVSAIAGDGQVTLTWTPAQADEGSTIVGYEVITYHSGASTVGPDVTSAVVTGLEDGQSYQVTVSALTTTGLGPPSTPSVPFVPEASAAVPDLVSATPAIGQDNFAWKAPSSGKKNLTGYEINDGSGVGIYVTAATMTADITGLAGNKTYKFSVAAITSKGVGPLSSRRATLPVGPPGEPVGVSATAAGAKVTAGWLAPPSNGGATLTKYVVDEYRCHAGVTPCSQVEVGSVSVSGSVHKVTISSLVSGTDYWFTVAAGNSAGLGTASAEVAAP